VKKLIAALPMILGGVAGFLIRQYDLISLTHLLLIALVVFVTSISYDVWKLQSSVDALTKRIIGNKDEV
jgi:hypothetical protein